MTQNATKQAESQAKQATGNAKKATDAAAGAAFEFPNVFRDLTEQTMTRAKQGYDTYKSLAEETTGAMEDALTTANKNAGDLQRQALVSAKAQMTAGFDFAEKMLSVKSVSEAIELQTSFMRQQFEAMQSNAKEFQEMTVRFQQESAKPFTGNFSKAIEQWRVGA